MEHTLAATAALLLLTAAAVLGFFALTGSFEGEESALAEKEQVFASEPVEEKMTLGVFEGKLALFAGESPYPNIVYDFLVRTLPPEDQTRLSEGIEVFSEEELSVLLEDFMS